MKRDHGLGITRHRSGCAHECHSVSMMGRSPNEKGACCVQYVIWS